jgi:hypothetical protein
MTIETQALGVEARDILDVDLSRTGQEPSQEASDYGRQPTSIEHELNYVALVRVGK